MNGLRGRGAGAIDSEGRTRRNKRSAVEEPGGERVEQQRVVAPRRLGARPADIVECVDVDRRRQNDQRLKMCATARQDIASARRDARQQRRLRGAQTDDVDAAVPRRPQAPRARAPLDRTRRRHRTAVGRRSRPGAPHRIRARMPRSPPRPAARRTCGRAARRTVARPRARSARIAPSPLEHRRSLRSRPLRTRRAAIVR
jgi:hypothetical protein